MDNTEIAAQWRIKTGRMTGVVVVFEGEVAGWMDALRNPEHWEIGCVAIDECGREFVAAGGNSRDGAKMWCAAIGQAT